MLKKGFCNYTHLILFLIYRGKKLKHSIATGQFFNDEKLKIKRFIKTL
jgi:hypothetical protein